MTPRDEFEFLRRCREAGGRLTFYGRWRLFATRLLSVFA